MAMLTPLFELMGMQKLVEKLPANNENFLANRFDRRGFLGDGQLVEWTTIQSGQTMSKPNVRGAQAHIIGHLGRGEKQAKAIYLRDKKQFDFSVLKALRDPSSLSKSNAEGYIAREVKDLNARMERFVEYCWWGVMTGALVLYYGDQNNVGLQAPVTVDYGLPAANTPTVGTPWPSATPSQIVADIRALRAIIENGSGVSPTEAFASEQVMSYIFDAFATNGDASAGGMLGGTVMSDRMKDEYYRSGTLPEFMELTWRRTRQVYQQENLGVTTPFFGTNSLIIGNFTTNDPMYLLETAPIAPGAAPGVRGKFAKSWDDPDPDVRWWLMEWGFMPIDERPEQRVYIADVTA